MYEVNLPVKIWDIVQTPFACDCGCCDEDEGVSKIEGKLRCDDLTLEFEATIAHDAQENRMIVASIRKPTPFGEDRLRLFVGSALEAMLAKHGDDFLV